jgi:hypothetical protein
LQARFRTVAGVADDAEEALVLVLRLSVSSRGTVPSRRRTVNIDSSPLP